MVLAQIDCLLGDVDENLRRAKEIIARAKSEGADLIVFPELSLAGYALRELSNEVAIEAQSEPIVSLAEEAGETGVVVGFVRRDAASTLITARPIWKGAPFSTSTASSTYRTTESTKRGNTRTRDRACGPSTPDSAGWPC